MITIPNNCHTFDKFCLYVCNHTTSTHNFLALYNSILEKDINIPTYCEFVFLEKTVSATLIRMTENYEQGQHYMEWQVQCDENTLKDICASHFSYMKDHINIFTWAYGKWTFYQPKQKRYKNSIYLPKDIDVFQDLKQFFQNKNVYSQLQIPATRIYLLEGLPGTGKTSLIHAIASEYNMSIAMLELECFHDPSEIKRAFKELPNNCIIVAEDIDSLFKERESTGHVSFSSYTNILDGLTAQNQFIMFCTTNYMKQIDKALKRRMDRVYHFSYAKPCQLLTFGISQEDAEFYTKHRTTVNIVQKFLIQQKPKESFRDFNNEYMTSYEFESMYI